MSRFIILAFFIILQFAPATEAHEGFFEDDSCLLQLHVDADEAVGEIGKNGLLQRSRQIARASSIGPVLDGGVGEGWLKPYDWLYTPSPHSCQKPEWDITQFSRVNRVFLPLLFLVLIRFVVLNGTSEPEDSEGSHSATEVEDFQKGNEQNLQPQRRYDLDIARIVCVCAVVTEHSGGGQWAKHNVIFGQQWVLPYLYITSAIAWTMSTRGVCAYTQRLAMVLAVGVAANWVADFMTSRDWRHDFGNTVFQMWYVVMIMAMAAATAPLRRALLWRKQNPHEKVILQAGHPTLGWHFWIPLTIYGAITAFAFACFFYHEEDKPLIDIVDPSWWRTLETTLNSAPIALIQFSGAMFLTHLACLFRANDIFAWLLVVHIFIPRIFIPWEKVGFVHNLELFLFGMVADSWRLRGQRTLSTAVQNYWPMVIFAMCILSMPDAFGRCDLMPAGTCLERARFYGIELILCFCLTSGTIKVSDPYNIIGWLGNWSLYAYCFHVAWARLFPIPYGAVVTYGSVILFYFAGRTNSSTSSDTKEKDYVVPGRDQPAPKKVPDRSGGG